MKSNLKIKLPPSLAIYLLKKGFNLGHVIVMESHRVVVKIQHGDLVKTIDYLADPNTVIPQKSLHERAKKWTIRNAHLAGKEFTDESVGLLHDKRRKQNRVRNAPRRLYRLPERLHDRPAERHKADNILRPGDVRPRITILHRDMERDEG